MTCSWFPRSLATVNQMNEDILNLLQCLEEFVQAQAELQSVMGDGYLEIADARRKSTGLLIPDLVLSPDQEARKLRDFDTLDENKQTIRISGVSEVCVRKCQQQFESALLCALRLAKIREQCQNRYEKVNCK